MRPYVGYNLLPRSPKGKGFSPSVSSGALLRVISVALVVALVVVYGYAVWLLRGLNLATSRLREEIPKMVASNKELEGKFEELVLISRSSQMAWDMVSGSYPVVRFLQMLEAGLPMGAWIEQLSFSDGKVVCEGYAFAEADVIDFVRSLSEAELVADVSAPVMRRERISPTGEILVRFRLGCQLRRVGELVGGVR